MRFDAFTHAYIEAALWSSNDELNEHGGEPLDKDYGVEDIAAETLEQMVKDCQEFQTVNAEWLISEYCPSQVDNTIDSQAGHDFWLTRNGHGAGFWDGDWEEPVATTLTEASKRFGDFTLYVGDDKKIRSL